MLPKYFILLIGCVILFATASSSGGDNQLTTADSGKPEKSPRFLWWFLVPRTSTRSCICGRKKPGTRIVGGTDAEVNEFPWQVALYRKNGGLFCGGSLITDRHVLSAAHCFIFNFASNVVVRLAEHDRGTTTESTTVVRRVSKIRKHEFYFMFNFKNDLAILTLDRPVTISDTILPICLPANDDSTYAGIDGIATGWGATAEGGPTTAVLQEVDVPILTNSDCKANSVYDSIPSSQICAGERGKDACQGDSGGPLVVPKGGDIYEQVGVVSYGVGCGRTTAPGVYTRVTSYLSWIQMNTQDGVYCT